MSTQRHVIKKQIIDIDVGPSADVHALQAQVSQVYRSQLVPFIEKSCSALCPADTLYRIDSLEIDLGFLDAATLKQSLPSKFEAAFQGALAKCLKAERPQQEKAQQRSQVELLNTFVYSGTLPWWADGTDSLLIGKTLLAWSRSNPEPCRGWLRAISYRPSRFKRLANHIDDSTFQTILQRLFAPLTQEIEATVAGLITPPSVPQTARQTFWRMFVQVLHVSGRDPAQLRPKLFYTLQKRSFPPQLLNLIFEKSGANVRSHQIQTADRAEIEQVLDKISKKLLTFPQTVQSEISALIRDYPNRPISKDDLTHLEDILRLADGPDSMLSPDDQLYVLNSGLILLWPFLTRFFEHLGLTDNNRFQDAAAQSKAVYLLHFLATGDSDLRPEFQLILNKLLCGLEPEQPLEPVDPLTEAEQTDCANFLQAVIAQAPILNQMSIDGFRSTFLLRNGILKSQDGNWCLNVEAQTFDIVLDKLPWPRSWVRLPWMKIPLQIKWDGNRS